MKTQRTRLIKIGNRYVAVLSGLRFVLSPTAIFCMLLALAACDLSWIAGKPSSTGTPTNTSGNSGGGGSTPTPALISSFVFQAAKNPPLTSDEVATITAPNVYITVPYSVIQNQTSLSPTVTLQTGYALTNPSGAFVPTDGMTLVITETSNSTISNYTLHVSVDPGSIAFLQLASPFYYDTHGIRQSLSAAQYTLSLAGTTNTYTLTLNTDGFTVPYNVNVVQAIVAAQSIGFAGVTVPYGSFTTNLSEALGGGVTPYTVVVQSPTKALTNTFTIQSTRTKSNIVQLTDVSATMAYIYSSSTKQTLTDSTLANFLNSQFSPSASDTYGTAWANSGFGYYWGNGGGPEWPSNDSVFTTTGGSWGNGSNGQGSDTFVTPSAQINANVAAINSVPAATVSGTIVSSPTTIDLGTSYTISNSSVSGSAPAIATITTPITTPISLTAEMQYYYNYTTYSPTLGTQQWYEDAIDTCTRTVSVPITQTESFTPVNYVQYLQIVVKVPLFDTIKQVAPATFVSSWTQTQNSTDYLLTFNFTPTTSKITGVVAQLQIAAETGNVSTYSLAIN